MMMLSGYYDLTTLTPLDENDITEYRILNDGLLLSSSIGPSSFQILIGSKSANNIIKPVRDYTSTGYNAQFTSLGVSLAEQASANGGDIFQYNTSSNNVDHPNFASYGSFSHQDDPTDPNFKKTIYNPQF